jgi:RNA polymerase sigma factor (TIGR02999 family)
MGAVDPGEITARLLDLRSGGEDARERLFASVYDQLKSLARRRLLLGGRTPTLGATALVHEAYLRLVDQTRVDWNDRAHFFAVASRAMRHIAIDQARRRAAAKRDGGARVPLDPSHAVEGTQVVDVLAVHLALEQLASVSPRLVQVVEMLFFAGLSVDEAAEALSASPSTVKRDWRNAVDLLREAGRTGEIESFLTEHRDRQIASAHTDERMVSKTERLLALHLVKSGRYADAEAYFALAEGRLRRTVPAGNWEIGRLLSERGACRTELASYPEAERLLLDGYDILTKDRAMKDAAALTRERLAKLYEAWGRPADAARWRSQP